MKLLGSLTCVALACTAACQSTGENTIRTLTKGIPVVATFTDNGYSFQCSEIIPNQAANSEKLKSITIIDEDGWSAKNITLYAPPDSEGRECKFYYPSLQGSTVFAGNNFKEWRAEGRTHYQAKNTAQRTTLADGTTIHTKFCPIQNHKGEWTLQIDYPTNVSTQAQFTKQLSFLFEYE